MTGRQGILTPLIFTPDKQPAEVRVEFIEQVQDVMRFVQAEPFVEALDLQQEALKVFYRVFFGYVNDWAKREQEKNKNIVSDPNAAPLREASIKVRQELEQNIIDFACCTMSLAHSKGIVASNSNKYKAHSVSGGQKIEWTKATTRMLSQSLIERQELLDSTKSLALGLHVLGQFETEHGALQELIDGVYGQKTGEKILKSLRSPLRNSGFEIAKKIINGMSKPKGMMFSASKKGVSFEALIKILCSYVDMLQKHADNLKVDNNADKLFLNKNELTVVLVTQMQELEQKEAFLNKYFMPYIAHTLRGFTLLQDKLAVVGSLESLVTLYIQMINGIAQPLKDMKDVREYETNVVEKIKFLLSSPFTEIENLQHLNNEDIRIFNENLSVFQDVIEKAQT